MSNNNKGCFWKLLEVAAFLFLWYGPQIVLTFFKDGDLLYNLFILLVEYVLSTLFVYFIFTFGKGDDD